MNLESNIRILGQEDVRRSCDMPQAIEAMKEAFSKLSSGEANVPVRNNLSVTDQTQFLTMPVAANASSSFGLKVVSLTSDNSQRGLPMIHAAVLLFDSTTGVLQAIMDGEYLTALRTGAATGLATDLLARSSASRLAVFGTGRQAEFQVEAVATVRTLKHVTIISRNPSSAGDFCSRVRQLGDFELQCTDDHRAIRDADIICTATPSSTPLFNGSDLPNDCHINAIGSYRADLCEVDPTLLGDMTVVVDQKEACLNEAGEIVQAVEMGILTNGAELIELGELINSPNAYKFEKRTLFKSVGNAMQDLVLGQRIYEFALSKGLGSTIHLR